MSGLLYGNGRVPLSLLVHLGQNWYLSPGTYGAWMALVVAAQIKYGVTLRITRQYQSWDGWSGYRPFDAQTIYRAKLGKVAAWPGTSPHGWCNAIDVENWRDLGPTEAIAWSRFVALCRLFGFLTLTIPGERWHIHYNGDPWAAPAGGGSIPFPTPEPPKAPEGEEEMSYIKTPQRGHYKVAPGVVIALADPTYIDQVLYVTGKNNTSRPTVLDVRDEDLEQWLFNESGFRDTDIPAPGYAWYAAIAYR